MYSQTIDNLKAMQTAGISIGDVDELIAGLDHEIELLDKKAATPRKQTATQKENENFKADIVEYLTAVDKPVSIAEIQNGVPSVSDLTNQRITHLLTALVNAGTIIKTYEKKSPRYTIAQ
jgi:hypothetical protein